MAYDSDSSMKLYLREISKTPLLTPDEERRSQSVSGWATQKPAPT
ncbi:MAG: sigma-70 factor domain-containing protein [Luteolibacter sp.]